MIYISIDIETAGLNSEQDSLLEFAAIVEDSNDLKSFEEIPKFQTYIINDKIIGDSFALNMNKGILEKLANYPKNERDFDFTAYDLLAHKFYYWLWNSKYNNLEFNYNDFIHNMHTREHPLNIIVAGKNFLAFDYKFLSKVPNFLRDFNICKRILDPTINYIDWKTDIIPPNITNCNKRAQQTNNNLHSAIYDCWNVIELIREKYK